MRELLSSKDVRNHLQKVGRKFNNFENAYVHIEHPTGRIQRKSFGYSNRCKSVLGIGK